jgi:hypothetical protein
MEKRVSMTQPQKTIPHDVFVRYSHKVMEEDKEVLKALADL